MKRICIFSFCIITIISCTKQVQTIPDNSNGTPKPGGTGTAITGTWVWERTDGGFGNHIHDTPASTGKTIEFTLAADSSYTLFVNGTLTSTGTYSLAVRKCIHDNASKPVIGFSATSLVGGMIEKADSTTLELSQDVYDGVSSQYRRK
jgi:hypothetical protein